jgi:hypothetical protein
MLETLMKTLGRGAMEIWLRMVIRDIYRQEDGDQEVRESASRHQ